MPVLNQSLIVGICLGAANPLALRGRQRSRWGDWDDLWSSSLCTPLPGLPFALAADPPPRRPRAGAAQ